MTAPDWLAADPLAQVLDGLAPEQVADLAERAAILEHDAHLDRQTAELTATGGLCA
jgi:hypothetical protein